MKILIILIVMSSTALAQTVCGKRQKLIDSLDKYHGEARVAMGLAASGKVTELLVGPSGNWSIIHSYPNGQSCLMNSGEGWQTVSPESKGKPS